MTTYRYTPVLVHHGIKGMHWGIRRDRTSAQTSRKTSKAYDDYKKAVRAFEEAEHLSTGDKRHYSGMEKALQMEKEAKKNFTREDKKQVKADRKENRRLSKQNMKAAKTQNMSPEEAKSRRKVEIGVVAAAAALATIGGIAYSKHIKSEAGKLAQAKGKAIFDEVRIKTPHMPTPSGWGYATARASSESGDFYSRQRLLNKKTLNARSFVKSTKKEIKSNNDMGKRIKYYLDHLDEGLDIIDIK